MAKSTKSAKQHMQDAAREHTHLNVFASIVSILEGGSIYGDNASARQILKICKVEEQRQLRIYDSETAAALRSAREK
jgi:hypothetical protein